MKIEYGRNSFTGFQRGQESCYLLTNGLGGYSSQTVIGSNARNDHALLMAARIAPNHRLHMITRIDERVKSNGISYELSSQQYAGYTKNREGYRYLDYFSMDYLPLWVYRVPGIEIRKRLVMPQGENTLGICYEIDNRTRREAVLEVVPMFQLVEKGEKCEAGQRISLKDKCVSLGENSIFFETEGELFPMEDAYTDDLYFEYDARDGRAAVGGAYKNHGIRFLIPAHSHGTKEIVYSMEAAPDKDCASMIDTEIKRQQALERIAGYQDEAAGMIARNAGQYIVRRESVDGKSIIAGYPFFGDWGRDTMIALPGLCIATGRLKEAREILGTFIKYRYKGLMPNVFEEGRNKPAYNTVDAALLFVISVYEYYLAGGDTEFVRNEAYPVMEEIIFWYRKGTDYHIGMDEDGLIAAGSGLEQVTWMDVRINGVLPTPRHGKPVEVNAQWYNVLRIASFFSRMLGKQDTDYEVLAEKVKESFAAKYWIGQEGYLRDVISEDGTGKADCQMRCNQIWAVSLPFSILDREKERSLVDAVYEHLYTPYGLRTLSMQDEEFCGEYGGRLEERDMAYHQGTVWTFPLGAYYLAYLKVHDYSAEAVDKVKKQLEPIREMLKEGCAGHLAEIYDGRYPDCSRGCFAQAWSMGEILRVYRRIQETEAS